MPRDRNGRLYLIVAAVIALMIAVIAVAAGPVLLRQLSSSLSALSSSSEQVEAR